VIFETWDIVDVNDARRRSKAQLDEWYEALAPGEDLRLVTVRLQNAERFVERAWGLVMETRRVHPGPPKV
jgi:hypothetical protein